MYTELNQLNSSKNRSTIQKSHVTNDLVYKDFFKYVYVILLSCKKLTVLNITR